MLEINAVIMHALLFLSLYFEVFLLITFFEWRESCHRHAMETASKPDEAAEARVPSVTILVPCFNEEKTVARTLSSLLSLDYPREKLAIIAIDDGSTDGTREVLESFSHHPHIRILSKENGGKATALNAAIPYVDTDLVGCLDADSFTDPRALREIVRVFAHNNVAAVTPAIKVYEPKTLIELIQKAEYALSVFIRRIFSEVNALFITPGPFSFFRTDVLKTIGPYKAAYNTEDLEIALRLQARGYRIGNAHSALVYTTAPATLRGLFRQRLRWSYGFLKNIIDYRFLFGRRRYGTLGLFILPTTVISFFGALYVTGVLIWSITLSVLHAIIQVEAIGFASLMPDAFDWFFINTESVLFLILVLVGLTAVIVMLGKTLLAERYPFSLDLVCYLAFYGFLAPLWLGRAVLSVITGERTSWR